MTREVVSIFDLEVAKQIVKAAADMEVSASEVNDLAVLRYGKPMRELTSKQLWEFKKHAEAARDRYLGPRGPEVIPEFIDERTHTEREWDRFVLARR